MSMDRKCPTAMSQGRIYLVSMCQSKMSYKRHSVCVSRKDISHGQYRNNIFIHLDAHFYSHCGQCVALDTFLRDKALSEQSKEAEGNNAISDALGCHAER